MSRGLDIEIDDERGRSSSQDHRKEALDRQVPERLPRKAIVWQLDRDSIPVERELPERDVRDSVNVRGSEYRLRQTEVDNLRDIGRFRVVRSKTFNALATPVTPFACGKTFAPFASKA